MQLIGVDTGGTFTDAVLILADGHVGVGKAPSTPDHLETGVLDSIGAAAQHAGLTRAEALGGTGFLAHGTTTGLNTLLTGSGARVGLLVTRGFEASVPMARANTVRGIKEEWKTEATLWDKPPLLLSRRRIQGVAERVDAEGRVVEALDERQAAEAIALLARAGVEAVAVALLWSHVHPDHELRLRALIREQMPEVPVSLSCQLAPRLGEYERAMTAVLDAYIAPVVSAYIQRLEAVLREEGFGGTFLVTRNGGGVQRASVLAGRTVETLRSGPIGGLVASATVGSYLGHPDVVATDVGGTSFDVGLVVGGEPTKAHRPMIGRWDLSTPMIDVDSVGTGGGSIAWLDRDLGALRVGPTSAGADPGPASYGLGGDQPTVTDAAVVLGYLDRTAAGELDRAAAVEAVERALAGPMGVTSEEAAAGVLDVACSQMADLVRRTTLLRGHDPARFALYAYGGAAAQYVGLYARSIGARTVVVPALASVFSAYGAVCADLRSSATRRIDPISLIPDSLGSAAVTISAGLADLAAAAEAELLGEPPGRRSQVGYQMAERDEAGSRPPRVHLARAVGLRFSRQVHDLPVPVPDGPLDAAGLAALLDQFRTAYEQLVGQGTAAETAPVEAVSLTVEATLHLPGRRSDAAIPAASGSPAPSRWRKAWFEGSWRECPVLLVAGVVPEVAVAGPAFIETTATTMVIYPGQSATLDHTGHLVLDLGVARP